MPTFSHEDTMISSQPRPFDEEYLDQNDVPEGTDGQPLRVSLMVRTRTLFRVISRQMSSFELSRQIYG